jgi:drug/metabolite transporter (DMT)-like permease
LAYVFSLIAASFYGAADFLGGLASRRAPTTAVIVVSGAAGLLLLAAILPWMPGTPTLHDLRWGATAGLAGGAGLGLLYRALAVGRMAVVAPTTAVCAVIIPALASFLGGERLRALATAGIVLALVAIVMVGQARDEGDDGPGERGTGPVAPRRGMGLALLSGVAIGFFYVALSQTSPDSGMWPLFASRATSTAIYMVAAIVTRRSLRIDRPVLRTVVAAGLLDMIANTFYVLATYRGSLPVVVTLTSLYPASTVLLARMVLGERLTRWQIAGVVCAMVAVAMIVGGS